MNSTQAQLNAKNFKIALLSKRLASSIAKKSRLRKVMILAEGKVKKQAYYLFKQLNLKATEAGNLNINIVLSGLLEDF